MSEAAQREWHAGRVKEGEARNGDECLAPLDPRAFDRPAGGSPALISGGNVVFRDLFRVRACGRRLASRGLLSSLAGLCSIIPLRCR